MQDLVRLRPVQQSDLPELMRIYTDPAVPGEFQWFGFRVAKAHELERRWADDGLLGGDSSTLVVGLKDGSCAGVVNWRAVGETGNLEIGICVFPEYRGRGIGTEAQRQLVDYLFATTPVHRLQAGTELDNVAEQRALERVGFRREGVARGLYFRDGQRARLGDLLGERSHRTVSRNAPRDRLARAAPNAGRERLERRGAMKMVLPAPHCGLRTQNSFPSGSANTTQGTSP